MISVLFVDDERAILDLTKIFLECSGDLSVDTAESVLQAVGMFNEKQYDVIVSDYQMLGQDGIDFLKYIRKHDQQIPFILFTGRGREEIVIEAFNHGADFYIRKGGMPEAQFAELERGIRESVRRRRAEQEQKRTASALRIKEAAIRSSLSPIVFSDFEGKLTYINPAFLSLWGYSSEADVLRRHISEFLEPSEQANKIIQALTHEGAWRGELKVRKQDGTHLEVRASANAIVEESGNSVGLMASFIDISQEEKARRQVESYLCDLEFISQKAIEMTDFLSRKDFYNFIADCLTRFVPPEALILIHSVDQRDSVVITRAVRGAEPVIREVEELLGRPLQGMVLFANMESLDDMLSGSIVELTGGVNQLTFGQLPKELCQNLQALPVTGKIFGIGFSWKGKINGNAIFVLPPGQQIKHPAILTIFVRNAAAVLQRWQAEDARRESETTARALINASPDASILIDTEGTILYANEIAASRIGKPMETLIGSNAFDQIPRELVSSCKGWMQEALESGRPVHFKDVGDKKFVDNYIYPIKDEEGVVIRLAITARDFVEHPELKIH